MDRERSKHAKKRPSPKKNEKHFIASCDPAQWPVSFRLADTVCRLQHLKEPNELAKATHLRRLKVFKLSSLNRVDAKTNSRILRDQLTTTGQLLTESISPARQFIDL